jgi:hypothetical protein
LYPKLAGRPAIAIHSPFKEGIFDWFQDAAHIKGCWTHVVSGRLLSSTSFLALALVETMRTKKRLGGHGEFCFLVAWDYMINKQGQVNKQTFNT